MLPAAAASTDGEVLPGQSTVAGLAASNSVLSCQDDQLLCTSFKRKCFTATLRKLCVFQFVFWLRNVRRIDSGLLWTRLCVDFLGNWANHRSYRAVKRSTVVLLFLSWSHRYKFRCLGECLLMDDSGKVSSLAIWKLKTTVLKCELVYIE